MFGANNEKEAGKSIFMGSMEGLANLLAVAAAFLGTPVLYSRTVEWIQDYTYDNYGSGFEDFTAFCWFLICGGLVYFSARATISTALMIGGAALVTRFV